MRRGVLGGTLYRLDRVLEFLGVVFRNVAIACLLMMFAATAATIILRPVGMDYYWIWPWTMVLFVWMTFFGVFAVYRFRKDIIIDILVKRVPESVAIFLRVLSPLVIFLVSVTVVTQIPTLMSVQGGPIDGALLPGGSELSRLFLTVPMGLSLVLVAIQSALDVLQVRPVGTPVTEVSQLGEQ